MSGARAKLGAPQIGANATRVAAFAAAVIAVVVVLFLIAASRGTYEVTGVFDDVRGLIPGGDVNAGSIPVGSVKSVELNDDGDPEVTMSISDEFQLHQGAFADIRLASNIGAVNRTVELSQGDVTLPELGDGAVLSGKQTDNPVDFDLAVSTLQPEVRAQIKKVLIGLDESLLNRGPDFDRTLRFSADTLNETANLLAEVNGDGEALRTLVSEGQRVISALASSPQDIGEAAERTGALLQTTANRQSELAESVQLLGPALQGGRQLLDRARVAVPNLRELVGGLGPVVDELGPFADLISPATAAANPFLDETEKLVGGAPDQLRATLPLFQDAQPLLQKFGPLTDLLNPIADELRIYTPETIGFFQNVADASANFDRNGHLIRVATTLGNTLPASAASGGTIGPSSCSPGLLEAPYFRTPGAVECDPWENVDQSRIGGDG